MKVSAKLKSATLSVGASSSGPLGLEESVGAAFVRRLKKFALLTLALSSRPEILSVIRIAFADPPMVFDTIASVNRRIDSAPQSRLSFLAAPRLRVVDLWSRRPVFDRRGAR